MLLTDFTRLAGHSVWAHRLRSVLTAVGIAIGIAAVVLLTSIGEGIQRFVLAEFTQFGTRILVINPGKTETAGISGAVLSSVRPLTVEDGESLRRLPGVGAVVSVVQGNGEIEWDRRQRRTTIIGTGAETPRIWRFGPALGRFLPADDPRAARPYAVLGAKVRTELFGARNPLGARVRIGGYSYRVIGVMESKGQVLGFDLDDAVYIPVARALEMFNREGVMEIDVVYGEQVDAQQLQRSVTQALVQRHGREDFTITTQEKMLDVLGSVLSVLTIAVGALGSISLVVGGIGILTIMTITVSERTAEIGLLRSLGAYRRQILWLFLLEAFFLAAAGGVAGLVIGMGAASLLGWLLPAVPVHLSPTFTALAFALALLIGLIAGILPARRAAGLDPVTALRSE
jgi:putative ABC transport system permease protein